MEQEEIEIIERKRKWFLEVHAATYDKLTSYTNTIIVAGYAAFFALWSSTSQLISPALLRSSAALTLFSLTIFISWEVTKMILIANNNKGLAIIATAPNEQFSELERKQIESEQVLMARLSKAWPIILYLSVPTALIGAGILLWALIWENIKP